MHVLQWCRQGQNLKAKAKAKAWTFKAKAKAWGSEAKAEAKASKFGLEAPRDQGQAKAMGPRPHRGHSFSSR